MARLLPLRRGSVLNRALRCRIDLFRRQEHDSPDARAPRLTYRKRERGGTLVVRKVSDGEGVTPCHADSQRCGEPLGRASLGCGGGGRGRQLRLELRLGRRGADPRNGGIGVSPSQLAVAAGFEPAEAFTSRAFEARSLGRSDTPPPGRLPKERARRESESPRAGPVGFARSVQTRRLPRQIPWGERPDPEVSVTPGISGRRRTPAAASPHSASRMPPRTSTRWFSRGSRTTSKSEATAPALGSYAPKTSRATRASTSAPAHMVHGSSVTTRV